MTDVPQNENAQATGGVREAATIRSAVLHRSLTSHLPTAVRGEGVYLFDVEGRRYLDASGGAAVSSLGHGNPAVLDAIRAQLARLEFAHTSFFTTDSAEALADRLIDLAPAGFGRGRVAFVSSGSEAVEAALKLARQHFVEKGEPRRTKFIARRMSYHGNTLGALSVGGHRSRRALYESLLLPVGFVSPCYPYRGLLPGESTQEYGARLASELATEIEESDPATVAAFVLEPIVGATLGAVVPVEGYLRLVREVCDRYGVLLIADEVMCGMGRCGAFFASAQEGVMPDLITVAKGLGAGYQPIGALLASEQVIDPIVRGSGLLAHGHTYMAHALACAAALAVLDCIANDKLLPVVVRQGRLLESRLREVLGERPYVGEIRGRGLLWAVELVRDRASKQPFAARLRIAARVKSLAQELGLICYPGAGTVDGTQGDHVLLAPPFTSSADHIGELVDKLVQALERICGSTSGG